MTNTENRQRKYDMRVMGDPTKENQSKKTEEIIKHFYSNVEIINL